MFPLALMPRALGLRLERLVLEDGKLDLWLQTSCPTAACPACGQAAQRVHSRYQRRLADLPWRGRVVRLLLRVRRFFCDRSACPRRIFAERLPTLASPRARCTSELTVAHRELGFALGGEAGARLARCLSMPTSPDTLLRRIHSTPQPTAPAARVLGIDDWALRKGQRYGTIVVDLERGRILDLLEGRDGTALTVWLQEHPGVEIIARDRWAAYAQAATAGAPGARQVADRWHLLKNLREVVERLLTRHSSEVRVALQQAPEAVTEPSQPAESPSEPAHQLPVSQTSVAGWRRHPRTQAQQARRQERMRQYQRVKNLHAEGQSQRQSWPPKANAIRFTPQTYRCMDAAWRPQRGGLIP